eukprot:TRINITY_DN977_c0_g1_i1.p2 TRINITY_DN977_c0_g1~~TRINITY_DN977_c0_g1_i1.p2  ORF type:complete len:101 (+),score=21.51 TRINITY_DN977_c0_g1_i1:3-305(+)
MGEEFVKLDTCATPRPQGDAAAAVWICPASVGDFASVGNATAVATAAKQGTTAPSQPSTVPQTLLIAPHEDPEALKPAPLVSSERERTPFALCGLGCRGL